jgi:hypothetical protein
MPRCSPSRDDPDAITALCVNDGQHLTAGHAEQDRPFFAVGFALINLLDGEPVVKGKGGLLEADTMIAKVRSRLVIIPLKSLILHILRATRIFCKCPV